MFKSFCSLALAGACLVPSTVALGSPCDNGAPATAATPGAPMNQAQRPQATRSFSYQPSTAVYRSNYRGWQAAGGMRSANSKALGNY